MGMYTHQTKALCPIRKPCVTIRIRVIWYGAVKGNASFPARVILLMIQVYLKLIAAGVLSAAIPCRSNSICRPLRKVRDVMVYLRDLDLRLTAGICLSARKSRVTKMVPALA